MKDYIKVPLDIAEAHGRHEKCVLVFGGAGYIGSHCVLELLRQDAYRVVVVDNFSTGNWEAIPKNVTVEVADIRDSFNLEKIFKRHAPIEAAFHFCGSIEVAESMRLPLAYYSNNVTGTLCILEMLEKFNVKYMVFSSTAAVYGTPKHDNPISEDDPKNPTSTYGETKLTVEKALHWCERAFGLRSAVLRYFNACGADADGNLGESHPHETHLIPLLLQVALGQRDSISIFGEDYPTPDGTCVRDYVHVSDLATAHILALEHMQENDCSDYFNLGSGRGHSVKEIVAAVRNVTGCDIPLNVLPRRPGDPSTLVASSTKAETRLGWRRRYSQIDDIVRSAWRFHQKYQNGFCNRNLGTELRSAHSDEFDLSQSFSDTQSPTASTAKSFCPQICNDEDNRHDPPLAASGGGRQFLPASFETLREKPLTAKPSLPSEESSSAKCILEAETEEIDTGRIKNVDSACLLTANSRDSLMSQSPEKPPLNSEGMVLVIPAAKYEKQKAIVSIKAPNSPSYYRSFVNYLQSMGARLFTFTENKKEPKPPKNIRLDAAINIDEDTRTMASREHLPRAPQKNPQFGNWSPPTSPPIKSNADSRWSFHHRRRRNSL